MGVRLTTDENVCALFDSVTGWAFGPTFDNSDDAEEFLASLETAGLGDVRTMTEVQLLAAHERWLNDREQASS